MKRWKWLGVVAVITVLALTANVAQATPSWGLDNGSEFEIAPTNNGGTSYASIDSAVSAGIGLGRTTMLFQGTWTGINETIDLRNNNLTFQGAAGSSMTWANTANLHAFGGQNGANFTATIKDLSVTTQGTGARGVTWYHSAWATSRSATLTVQDSTFSTVGDGIYVVANTSGGSAKCNVTVEILDSTIKSSEARGAVAQASQGYASGTVGTLLVRNSRIEALQNGVRLTGHSSAGTIPSVDLRVEASEIVSTNSDPGNTYLGVSATRYISSHPFVVVDSLIAGFGKGVSAGTPVKTDNLGQAVTLLNNTIVGTGSSTGVAIGFPAGSSNNWDTMTAMLVNNILAGHAVGLSVVEGATSGGLINIRGDYNAFLDNTTDVTTSGSVSMGDNNRLTPAGYTVANTFIDPVGGNYRLGPGATVLIDAGEQFTTAALGGTSIFVDYNNNGTYQDGTDYVIDLGGGIPTASTRLFLVDADYDLVVVRLLNGVIEIGAYEGAGAALAIPEPGLLGLVGMALLALRRRRS